MNSSAIHRGFAWLVTLLMPIALALLAVRLVLNPLFVRFEYSTPGFPDDPFGFTRQERLHWSRIALDYLLNSEGINFLGDLRFDNGQPVYNERELRHMLDVKNVLTAALNVWYLSLAILLVLGVWAWRGRWWTEFRRGVSRGGWLTVILIAAIILFVLFGFDVFFVAFHRIFFEGNSWLFLYSDTLIRLFPERFWQIVFLVVGSLAAGLGLLAGYLFRVRK
jgi:integral membrane protein (TIGR01906 family)